MLGSNYCFLTRIRFSQEAGKVVWYSYLFNSFPQFVMIHTVKGCSVANEANVFLEFPWFFYDPMDIGNLISGSSAFYKSSLNIWKLMVYILLKPGLENFEHYFASVWDECNCVLVWTFFGIAFLKLDLIISERNYHGLVEQKLGIQSSELSYIALTCSVRSLCDPMDCSPPALLSIGFYRNEY